jgi:hypothetical protein
VYTGPEPAELGQGGLTPTLPKLGRQTRCVFKQTRTVWSRDRVDIPRPPDVTILLPVYPTHNEEVWHNGHTDRCVYHGLSGLLVKNTVNPSLKLYGV